MGFNSQVLASTIFLKVRSASFLCSSGFYICIYLAVILSGIPKLGPENRNEAARFLALIDAFYEARIKLVASAAAEPEHLYPEGDGSFEFERTASRLHEMRSTDYLAEARVEIDVDAPRD